MHPKRNNVIQLDAKRRKAPAADIFNDKQISVDLDKNDLICLITAYKVNGVLPDGYYRKDENGIYKWDVIRLWACELHELVTIFQWAKLGGVGGAV